MLYGVARSFFQLPHADGPRIIKHKRPKILGKLLGKLTTGVWTVNHESWLAGRGYPPHFAIILVRQDIGRSVGGHSYIPQPLWLPRLKPLLTNDAIAV